MDQTNHQGASSRLQNPVSLRPDWEALFLTKQPPQRGMSKHENAPLPSSLAHDTKLLSSNTAKVLDVYIYLPASDKLTLAGNEASKKLLPNSEHGGTLSQMFSRQKSPSPQNQLGREEVEEGQKSSTVEEFLEIIHHLLS